MKRFVQLFHELDSTTSSNKKVDALVSYLHEVSSDDKIWTIALFTGRHPRRAVKTAQLRHWAATMANLPDWLFAECHAIVGDLSETIAAVLPDYDNPTNETLAWWMQKIQSLHQQTPDEQQQFITGVWQQMSKEERFVFNKLTSGTFRVGVSANLLIRALSKYTQKTEAVLAHRLMGNWQPTEITFEQLILEIRAEDDISKPYPFYLAYGLDHEVTTLGNALDWQVEYKWDGIRCQLIKRNGQFFLWSRGEELITTRFPEFEQILSHIPDGTVIDGELVSANDAGVLPFHLLQKRIGRKVVSDKIKKEVPVSIIAYDVLEWEENDIRSMPLTGRYEILSDLVNRIQSPLLRLSAPITCYDWETVAATRQQARAVNAEGIMLKHKSSSYQTGRKRGEWWKWKLDPFSIDAVMIYAMSGSGRRANLYTDYTFAVWKNNELVPFAKAYSGLTDVEIQELDRWIKQNTIEKFGPVRSVHPVMVFELGFEGINYSSRHKSGVAVRFPRILRWRKDKVPQEADSLETLCALISNE
jgi:DNA ligase-1